MDLTRQSSVAIGPHTYTLQTELLGEGEPHIQTVILKDGEQVYATRQDVSALRPIFQHSTEVFRLLEEQHALCEAELRSGSFSEVLNFPEASTPPDSVASAPASDAADTLRLESAIAMMGVAWDEAVQEFRSMSEFSHLPEARELADVCRLSRSQAVIDVEEVVELGAKALAEGRLADASRAWKASLAQQPQSRALQLLVMLPATTSAERQTAYMDEILAGDASLLSQGSNASRALLLVAQAMETGMPTRSAPDRTHPEDDALERALAGSASAQLDAETQFDDAQTLNAPWEIVDQDNVAPLGKTAKQTPPGTAPVAVLHTVAEGGDEAVLFDSDDGSESSLPQTYGPPPPSFPDAVEEPGMASPWEEPALPAPVAPLAPDEPAPRSVKAEQPHIAGLEDATVVQTVTSSAETSQPDSEPTMVIDNPFPVDNLHASESHDDQGSVAGSVAESQADPVPATPPAPTPAVDQDATWMAPMAEAMPGSETVLQSPESPPSAPSAAFDDATMLTALAEPNTSQPAQADEPAKTTQPAPEHAADETLLQPISEDVSLAVTSPLEATPDPVAPASEESTAPETAQSRPTTPTPKSAPSGGETKSAVDPKSISQPTTPSRPLAPRPAATRASSRLPLYAIAAAAVFTALGGGAFWMSSQSVDTSREFDAASQLLGAGSYSAAALAYDAILDEHGEVAAAYLGRGRARVASGDTQTGLQDLNRAYEIDASLPELSQEIGDIHYSQADYEQALTYYETANAQGGVDAESRFRLATSLTRVGRGSEAMAHLEAAVEQAPAHGEARFLYAHLLNESGQFALAEQQLRAAKGHVDAGADYHAVLGIALLEQQKLNEAEEIARQFLDQSPSDPRVRGLLGEIYFRRSQFEAARRELIEALKIDPAEPRAQIALGLTWISIGERKGDANDLGKARRILTDARGVNEASRSFALGQLSLAEGNLEEAKTRLSRALAEGAPELSTRLSLAKAKARSNDLQGAAEEFARASALAPDDTSITLSLAVLYSQLNEPSRAAAQFIKAMNALGISAGGTADSESGPIVLPTPYVNLPNRFDVNRAIRDTHEGLLKQSENDPGGMQLRGLAEGSRFVFDNV